MVNEYSSSSEYGGGPSPGYSGAGGGSPGSSYTSDPTSAASAAAALVTGGNVVSGQVISGSYGSDSAFQEALTVGVTTPQFGTASSYDITPRGPSTPSSGGGLDYGMGGAPVYSSSSGIVQPFPSSISANVAAASAAAAQQAAQQSSSSPSGTYYVPYGSRTQTELKDISSVRFGAAGEVGFYQSLYTPEGTLRNITNLVSSGGPGALQSGMFSDKPLTPDIRTQENPEAYARTAIPLSAAAVRASPESFSRLGAEVYGGYVLPLEPNRTVESVGAELSTYAPESGNLARLVSPQGANLPRSEYISLPWGEYVAPGSGTRKVGSDTSGFREFTAPTQIAASSYDITLKAIPSTTRGPDYGIGTKYVPSESIMLPQKTTIDIGTIPIVGMFAAPVVRTFGLSRDIEAGALGAFVNPPMKETSKAGTPVVLPETIIPGETTVRKTPEGYEITTTETKTGGTVTPYVITQEVAGKSGLQKLLDEPLTNIFEGLEQPAQKGLKENVAYQEAIKSTPQPKPIVELGAFEPTQYSTKFLTPIAEEVVSQFKTAPITGFTTKVGEGIILGEVFAGLGAGFGIAKTAAEPLLKSPTTSGTIARGVSAVSTPIVENIGPIFATLYGGKVAYESTEGGKQLELSKVSARAGEIVAPDILVFTGMGIHGGEFRTPEVISKVSKMEIPSAEDILGRAGPSAYERRSTHLAISDTESAVFSFGNVRPSRPGQIEPALPERGVDISEVGLISETPSATSLTSVKSYGQRTQGYPARTLQETEMLKGRMATPAEEYLAQSIETSPLAQLSVTGRMGPSFKEQVTVSEYLKYRSELYGQPESVQTQLYKLSRLEPISEVPPPTIETQPAKMATPNPFAGLAKEMGVRAEPITPKGLETKVSGAPMSKQMLESVVTKPTVRTSGQISSIEEIIKTTEARSIAKPIVGAVESQRILPSATKKTFSRETQIPKEKFKTALENVIGEEKRPVTSGKLPKGMQLDYLKEALSARKSEVIPRKGFIEETPVTKAVVRPSYLKQLQEERSTRGTSAGVSISERQSQKTTSERATKQKQRIVGELTSTSAATSEKTRAISNVAITQKETTSRITPVITPTRIVTPKETTVTIPRIVKVPQRTTLKIPGLVPNVPSGGGGAGVRGERGRRFTKELRVGEGIGWIQFAGPQRRTSRKK